MPAIPATFSEDTGFFIEENGHLVFKRRNVTLVDYGAPGDFPYAMGAVPKSDGVKLTAQQLSAKFLLRIPAASGIDTDGVGGFIAGCGMPLDLTQTEATAAYCKVYDDSAATKYRAIGAVAAADFVQWQVFPNNTQDDDAVYFGGSLPWCEARLDLSAVVSTYGGDALTWEYWDGTAWSTLTLHDGTDAAAADGKQSFGQDGAFSFGPPNDWASTTIDGQDGYWVRARVSTVANLIVIGKLNAHRHIFVAPADGFTVPAACTITDIAICDEAAVVHTTADIKLVLFNFTTGTQSGELTFAMDKRRDSWGPIAMGCSAGDVLGVLITQEDGAAEAGPFTLELQVALL